MSIDQEVHALAAAAAVSHDGNGNSSLYQQPQHPQRHFDPFTAPTATNPRMQATNVPSTVRTPAPQTDDDDGFGLTARELEGLVDGAKHLAVVIFAAAAAPATTGGVLSGVPHPVAM